MTHDDTIMALSGAVQSIIRARFAGTDHEPGIGDVARMTESVFQLSAVMDVDKENAVILEVCRRLGITG